MNTYESQIYEKISNEIGRNIYDMRDEYYGTSLLLKSGTVLRHYYTSEISPYSGIKKAEYGKVYYYVIQKLGKHENHNVCRALIFNLLYLYFEINSNLFYKILFQVFQSSLRYKLRYLVKITAFKQLSYQAC